MLTPIPAEAHEVIVAAWETGAKQIAHYFVDEQRVGYRQWDAAGQLVMEYGVLNERMHGLFRTWHDNGQLCEVTWYQHGNEHGTSQQYDAEGTLIGTYTMVHGSGVDLWFERRGVVAEERHYQDGERHGYERWWTGDNATVWQESHFWQGQEHGIVREWNAKGRLRRGYPRYFVAGQQVRKRQYERACLTDATLPPFRAEDNLPPRSLPTQIA